MESIQSRSRDRTKAAAVTAVLQALFGYAFLVGLGVGLPVTIREQVAVVAVTTIPVPPPPEPPLAHRTQDERREAAGSPPNVRSTPTEIVAPLPAVPLSAPSPVVAAKLPGPGSDPSAGAADLPGPGTGRGGRGSGRGTGNEGDGDGGGGTPPRWLSGRIRNSDYPPTAGETGVGGTVSVRYRVATNGRVTQCVVTRSSGSAELDRATCRLIVQRFRFEPSRDEDGRAVPALIVENHSWMVRQVPPEPTAR